MQKKVGTFIVVIFHRHVSHHALGRSKGTQPTKRKPVKNNTLDASDVNDEEPEQAAESEYEERRCRWGLISILQRLFKKGFISIMSRFGKDSAVIAS